MSRRHRRSIHSRGSPPSPSAPRSPAARRAPRAGAADRGRPSRRARCSGHHAGPVDQHGPPRRHRHRRRPDDAHPVRRTDRRREADRHLRIRSRRRRGPVQRRHPRARWIGPRLRLRPRRRRPEPRRDGRPDHRRTRSPICAPCSRPPRSRRRTCSSATRSVAGTPWSTLTGIPDDVVGAVMAEVRPPAASQRMAQAAAARVRDRVRGDQGRSRRGHDLRDRPDPQPRGAQVSARVPTRRSPPKGLGAKPLIVLASADTAVVSEGLEPALGAKIVDIWWRLQEDLAGRSTAGRLEKVTGATHEIIFERPDAVAAAIRGGPRLLTSVHLAPVRATRAGPPARARPGARPTDRGGSLNDEDAPSPPQRGKTVHGEAANAGHRVLAPDDAEVEAYLETALKAPGPGPLAGRPPGGADRRAPGHRRRPRLRQPVRPADRPPRPRAQRLLGAAAVRHAVRGARAPRRRGDHPVGRPELASTTTARPEPDPAIWSGQASRSSASATAPS